MTTEKLRPPTAPEYAQEADWSDHIGIGALILTALGAVIAAFVFVPMFAVGATLFVVASYIVGRIATR